jgi:hypothetical protein
VEGNTFPDFAAAAQRSCDVQFQGCQGMANGDGGGKGKGKGKGMTVGMCDEQRGEWGCQ